MVNLIANTFLVEGRVQKVAFRVTARDRAVGLGLTGWIINGVDGTVKGLVQGEQEKVKAFCDWLWEGSTFAKVSNVTCAESELSDFMEFEIIR